MENNHTDTTLEPAAEELINEETAPAQAPSAGEKGRTAKNSPRGNGDPARKSRYSGKRRHRKRTHNDHTLAAVNAVLLILAGISLAFCAYTGYRYMTFSTEPYDLQVAALSEETEQVSADIAELELKLAQENERMRSNLALSGEEGSRAADDLNTAQEENEALKAEHTVLEERIEFLSDVRGNTVALRQEYAKKIRMLEDRIVAGESDAKICYWSFDDGPGQMTSAILDFCEENGVYVTFFTSREANETGQGDVDEPALLRRETMLGNSVQNHTNSHQYSKIAGNLYTQGLDSFREQVRLQDEWILENTGFKADIFRFPGGSAWAYNLIPKEQLLGALEELGYTHVDWACDVMDNLHSNPDAGIVYTRATWQIKQIDPPIAIILSHDWNMNTYYGFMRAVPAIRDLGYIFLPLFSESWAIDNTVIRFS